jgi:hypothetical protein
MPTAREARTTRPNACHACQHPQRAEIESLVCNGASQRSVGERFGLSKDIVSRHFKRHLSRERRAELMVGPDRVKDLAEAAAKESRSLLDQMQVVRSVLFSRFLASAEAADNVGVALTASRLLESLRELGKLTGELRQVSGISIQNNSINLFASPDFTRLAEGLLEVCRSHPGAKADILALLRRLEAQPPGANGSHHPVMIDGVALPRAPEMLCEAAHVD